MKSKVKRFIKKLMGFEYARNDAVLLQQHAGIFSYPYVMYTAQLHLRQTLIALKSYGLFVNNKRSIQIILEEASYSRYVALSTIPLLKGEETNIIKSKKLKAMEPFLSIKPQALKKQC